MASVLPIFFVAAAGLCLTLVLLALWNSLRWTLARGEGQPAASARAPEHAGRIALLREKQELLSALRDLRSEHELGKLSLADYQELEQRYRARARDVLRQLEEQVAPYRARAQALLEAAIGGAPGTQPAPEQASDASRASAAPGCASCGAQNDADAVFCKKCGKRLAPAVSAS